MLHTEYQGSRPSGFREVFYVLSVQANVTHVTPAPPGGAIFE